MQGLTHRLRCRISALLVAMFLGSSGATAATLNVVGGRLAGASGVQVDGELFDVQFLDGTCGEVFDGCDSLSDFDFDTRSSAESAAQALLDQVFLDGESGAFDTSPGLTFGCDYNTWCMAWTPYEQADFGAGVFGVHAMAAQNPSPVYGNDSSTSWGIWDYYDTSEEGQYVWVAWTPIPEPSMNLLMLLGLAGLSWRRHLA